VASTELAATTTIASSSSGTFTMSVGYPRLIERLAYDPFGKRRATGGQFDPTGAIEAQSTNRGFTGHEHLDELDFIHMNARVYDPDIGRFLSPDPTVPGVYNPQAYNRYAYTINNPLNLVDKDGFSFHPPTSLADASNAYDNPKSSSVPADSSLAPVTTPASPTTDNVPKGGSGSNNNSSFTGGHSRENDVQVAWAQLAKEALKDPRVQAGLAAALAWAADQASKGLQAVRDALTTNAVKADEAAGSSGNNTDAAGAEGQTGADENKDVTQRPSRVRKGTEQANWDNAEDGEDGGKRCPTCDREVKSKPGEKNKDWDNDHIEKWKNRDLRGKNRKEVLDEYNRDTRLRCVNCNRSDNK
jgi:RHS repeat-associated protein